IVVAGRAPGGEEIAGAKRHVRIERVRGTLAGLERVGLGWIETEAAQAVVHDNAGVPGDDMGAEHREYALDERDDVAVAVGGAEIRRVAAGRGGADYRPRAIGNQPAALFRVRFGYQAADLRIAEPRIVEMIDAVLERELLRLDHHVDRLGRIHLRERIRFEQVQHLQHHESLRHGRLLIESKIVVRGAERLEPLGEVPAEVFFADNAAGGFQRSAYLSGQWAGIKTVAAFLCDRLDRLRQARLREHAAGRNAARALPIVAVNIGSFRFFDALSQPSRDGKAVAAERDGVGGDALKVDRAVALVQCAPAVDRAGYSDAERSFRRYVRMAEAAIVFDAGFFRRRAARVQRLDLAGFLHVEEHEDVAAGAGGLRGNDR